MSGVKIGTSMKHRSVGIDEHTGYIEDDADEYQDQVGVAVEDLKDAASTTLERL